MKPLLERFNEKWMPEPYSGCWLWTGCGAATKRYGSLKVKGAMVSAHRLSWEIHHGLIPSGLHVLHKCDTGLCVNPDHLFVGTNSDNMRDCLNKGRGNRCKGEQHGLSKLTDSEVIQIRRLKSQFGELALARQFGVSKTLVHLIVHRRIWKHLQ